MSVMPTTSALMTVEQFCALPDPKGGYYELQHGVPVFTTFPKHRHSEAQRRLVKLLEAPAAGRGIVWPEFAFRPLPEHELWRADVAYVSQERYDAIDLDDYFRGAPELVIEVLSPSNSATEVAEREAMCLENSCLEFWVADPRRKTVKVSTPDRKSITYIEGETIPLKIPAPGELAVSVIFSNL